MTSWCNVRPQHVTSGSYVRILPYPASFFKVRCNRGLTALLWEKPQCNCEDDGEGIKTRIPSLGTIFAERNIRELIYRDRLHIFFFTYRKLIIQGSSTHLQIRYSLPYYMKVKQAVTPC